MLSSSIFCGLALLASLSLALAANAPSQLHLAFAGNKGMTVSWTTASQLAKAPAIVYGTSPSQLTNTVQGVSHTYGTSWFHDVVIYGLPNSAKFYYQVAADPSSEASSVNTFVTARAPGDANPYRVLVMGDMGMKNSPNTMSAIIDSINQTDFVYHIGDIAYADDYYLRLSTYEATWEEYMNDVEPFTSVLPYMVLPGNHEATCTEVTPFICPDNQKNFTAYRHRFRMPSEESGGSENMWWSVDAGLVHFVSISTETDFPDSPEGEGTYLGGGPFGNQLGWLENDLQKAAANRQNVPWIVVGGHRPLYSSANSDRCDSCAKAFEPLFLKYNVDLVFHGHIHNAQRLYSIANGVVMDKTYVDSPAPIYIIIGNAGNEEGHSSLGSNSLFAFADNKNYGYGFLDVYNSTALGFRFHAADNHAVLDSVTIVKHKH